MRHTDGDDWATLIKVGRLRERLSQIALAAAVGVSRETVWRWEHGKQKPENAEIVVRIAGALREDYNRLMRAAGLALDTAGASAADPRLRGLDPNDRVVKRILDPALQVSDEMRARMLERRRRILADREKQDLDDLEFIAERERGVA